MTLDAFDLARYVDAEYRQQIDFQIGVFHGAAVSRLAAVFASLSGYLNKPTRDSTMHIQLPAAGGIIKLAGALGEISGMPVAKR